MPRGYRFPQELKDKVLAEVALYQSEKKTTLKDAIEKVAKKNEVTAKTVHHWYYQSRGKNQVISTVAKRKDNDAVKSARIAATTLSAQMDAERIIFNHIKNLSFFKRILAVIIGLDKLCYNYGSKSVH